MPNNTTSKKDEFKMIVFICVFLFPLLATTIVGAYGLAIWLSQIFFGH